MKSIIYRNIATIDTIQEGTTFESQSKTTNQAEGSAFAKSEFQPSVERFAEARTAALPNPFASDGRAMASYRTDREDSTKRYWQDHDEVKASVKKIGKRFGRLIPDFLSNIVANPLRNAAKMTWQLLAIPAKLMWNGRLDNHPRYAGEKSMKNSVKGLGMLIVTTLLLPLEFSVAFLAAEFMNLGNTVKDPFKMVFTGTVGEQFEYDF